MRGHTFLKRADGHEEFAVKFRATVAVSRLRRRIITVNKIVGINYVFIEAEPEDRLFSSEAWYFNLCKLRGT